jgi:hypothetical protein
MIAEAENSKPFRFNHGRSFRICSFPLIGEVLTAIDFDHKLCRMADEIGNIVFDGDLAAEAGPAETMIA